MIGKTNVVINNNLGTLVWNGLVEFFLSYKDNVFTWHSDTLLTDSSLIYAETFTISVNSTKRHLTLLPTTDTPLTGYTAWECTDELAAEVEHGLIVKYYVLIDSNNNLSLYAKMNELQGRIWRDIFTALYKK